MAKSKKRRNILIVGAVLVVAGILVWLKTVRSGVEPIEVETARVHRQTVVHKVTSSGTIQPQREVDISANISALIMDILVEEGDSVRVGQHLISLDRTRYEAAVDQAHSRLKAAEASLVKAQALKERAEKLYDQALISSQELESSTAQFQMAESEVELAGAALKSAMDELSKTTLLAPRSGMVTQIRKEEGEMALGSTFQADVLMTIADLSKMEVVVQVNENDVVDVSPGDTAEISIDAFQDTVFHGVVKEIAHVAQTTAVGTQEQVTNFDVRIVLFDVPRGIRQGMSATVDIITDVKPDVLAIPIQALTVRSRVPPGSGLKGESTGSRRKSSRGRSRRAGGGSGKGPPGAGDGFDGGEWTRKNMVEVVFVVADTSNGPPVSEQREVKVGLSSETHYEVLSGLEENEEIITGSYRIVSRELEHGSPVERKTNPTPGRRP
ncbi:MAG: efflux RND transporter periplasmic adaptor subunit [Fidelibacterota bacterium]